MRSSEKRPLKRRVLDAGAWSLTGYVFGQVIRLGSNLLLTRLLAPEMFGIMAIALMVIAGLSMFSDIGLRQSVIHNSRGDQPAFLNSAWAIQIIRGAILSIVGILVALVIFSAAQIGLAPNDTVYSDQRLPFVLAIISITAIVAGFNSTKFYEASRNLSLDGVTRIEIASQLIGLAGILGWIIWDRSIWALVAGNVCSAVSRLILGHRWLPGSSNRWEWDESAVASIVRFGKWIFASSILGFFVTNGDRLVLGGLIDSNTFGVYVIAFFIFNSVEQLLSKIIGDVSFPAFSELARDKAINLKQAFSRFYCAAALFAYFCSGLLMVSGQTLIGVLYDKRYEQAGWMLEILAVALLVSPVHVTTACFLALGLPRLNSQLVGYRLVGLFLFVPLGFHLYGLIGAIWGIVASYFSTLIPSFFYRKNHGLFNLTEELFLLPAWFAGMLFAKGLNVVFGQ